MSRTPTSDDPARLQRHAARIALACTIAIGVFPTLVVIGWIYADPARALASAPSFGAEVLALALSLIPVGLLAFALLAARRCFAAFAEGGWFTDVPARSLAMFGRRLMAAGLAGLIVPTLVTLVLTIGNPPGERTLAITLSSTPVSGLLFGAMVWCLGDVWQRARRLADDHAQIV